MAIDRKIEVLHSPFRPTNTVHIRGSPPRVKSSSKFRNSLTPSMWILRIYTRPQLLKSNGRSKMIGIPAEGSVQRLIFLAEHFATP